jgi:ribosome-associated toxin RatA of RatAB toxin-antitoxin module
MEARMPCLYITKIKKQSKQKKNIVAETRVLKFTHHEIFETRKKNKQKNNCIKKQIKQYHQE